MFRNRLGIMLIRMCQKGAIPGNAFDQTLKLTTTLTQQFPSQQCDRESPLYLEWDGFVSVMESWTNVMKSDSELRDLLREKAVSLARLVLNYDPGDALVLCCVLRCMNSGLLWVVDIDPQLLLQPYLQKIFSCVESLGKVESKTRKVMAAQNIAMQCFIKLCSQFGSLLLPYLPQLYEQYETAVKQDIISYSMRASFIEGFVILNLLRPDLEQQRVFLRQLMQDASTVLRELQRCGALSSLEGLVRYLGIHTSPEDPAFCPDHRAQLCYVGHVVSVVLKNSVLPSNRQPGQPLPASPEQHPSYQLTVPLLTQFVLPVIQLLHELWSGKAKHLTSSYFQHLYQLSIAEKEIIRGKVLSYSASQPGQGEGTSQMQNTLVSTLEVCLQCVANSFSVFGCQHMLDIGFVDACLKTIFPSTAGLDCWKMRGVIRGVTLPLVKLCPPEMWQSVLLPFLLQCCHTVFTKLRQSWEEIEENKTSAGVSAEQIEGIMYGAGDEGEISQEVIDEQFAIVLSRDYASLIEAVCMTKKQVEGEKGGEGGGEKCDSGEVEEEMEEVKEGGAGWRGSGIRDKWMSSHEIAPLASHLLSSGGAMCELLFISVFSGLSWGDTRCAHTFTNIAGLIIMKVSTGLLPVPVIGKLFEQVLVALQKHGIHEGNRTALTSLAQLMYETMVSSLRTPLST
ncbi:Exportin-5 [Geodia barretti]|uniref:Exportin-5 n=1 Tax=Geodia barretti TaxID=519541 RepID=A0AA35SJK2_GEOBA|nr:Exportin-5 [Geodia barretti]